jgi:hypothetical protein
MDYSTSQAWLFYRFGNIIPNIRFCDEIQYNSRFLKTFIYCGNTIPKEIGMRYLNNLKLTPAAVLGLSILLASGCGGGSSSRSTETSG